MLQNDVFKHVFMIYYFIFGAFNNNLILQKDNDFAI
jgi:hypothetical protein